MEGSGSLGGMTRPGGRVPQFSPLLRKTLPNSRIDKPSPLVGEGGAAVGGDG